MLTIAAAGVALESDALVSGQCLMEADYGKVILPFTVLRRLDCVLKDTKSAVLAEHEKRKGGSVDPDVFLKRKAGVPFYNTSKLDFEKLRGERWVPAARFSTPIVARASAHSWAMKRSASSFVL
jgi:hypothetical protein